MQSGIARQDGVLWLWHKHNLVNVRLAAEQRKRDAGAAGAGGTATDPAHPKGLFPSARACPDCLDRTGTHWRVPAVLSFLSDSYCSREPSDLFFTCARERAGLSPAGAGGGGGEPVARGSGWKGPVLALVLCALCCGLAAAPWLCSAQCERLSAELENSLETAEDRKLAQRLDREARHDQANAARRAADEAAAAAARVEAGRATVGADAAAHTGAPEPDGASDIAAGSPAAAGSRAGAGAARGGYMQLQEGETQLWT